MEFLITLIGNAVVNPTFREKFLDAPAQTIRDYGFRLTKGDHELMMQVFGKLTPAERLELDNAFLTLENQLYAKVETVICGKPCRWSIYEGSELPVASTKAA
jgi:hypothetical protein